MLLLLSALAFADSLDDQAYVEPAWVVAPKELEDASDDERAGLIWDVRRETFVDPIEMYWSLRSAQFIVIGEDHENRHHHRFLDRIVEQVAEPDLRVVLQRPHHVHAMDLADHAGATTLRALPPGDAPAEIDGFMALNLTKDGPRALLVADGDHALDDGVPSHLEGAVSVLFHGAGEALPEAFAADFVWFTKD